MAEEKSIEQRDSVFLRPIGDNFAALAANSMSYFEFLTSECPFLVQVWICKMKKPWVRYNVHDLVELCLPCFDEIACARGNY